MENLLKNDFTAHYGLSACIAQDLVIQTNEPYFELEDTPKKDIVLYIKIGAGTARFSNPKTATVTVAKYEKFVTSLPNSFQRDRKRCDIIVCDDGENLILGEIKDSTNIKRHRKKAKKQLYESLTTLLAVPQFLKLTNKKTVKRCCYFNKQSDAPSIITATTAFNRLSEIFPEGFQMSHPAIEEQNFEFWEYLGNQTLTLT